MATMGTLHDAFIDELHDVYDAEKQLTKALGKLAKASTSADLREAFENHLEETRGQVERLERVFSNLNERPRGKHCDGIAGIIEEADSMMDENFGDGTMDAVLIASGQRAEHYEMAAYGTLVSWARSMGHNEVAELLQQTLDEEKSADEKLTSLAEGGINSEAARGAHTDSGDDEESSRSYVDSDADSDETEEVMNSNRMDDSQGDGRAHSNSGNSSSRSSSGRSSGRANGGRGKSSRSSSSRSSGSRSGSRSRSRSTSSRSRASTR